MSTLRYRGLAFVGALLVAAPLAPAQDDCASPTVISGNGVFAFDNGIATPGPQSNGGPQCPVIGRDIWFRWTATQSGLATLHTCGQVAHDSAIAVYPTGTCPGSGTSIACDDDACGLESLVTFPAQAGGAYMFQIGSSGSGPGGPGTITIDVQGPPSNDDCSTPLVITGQSAVNYDSTIATNSPQGMGHIACSDVGKDLWYEWVAPQDGTATVDTCFQSGMDTAVKIFAGSGCPTNAPIACDDNGCGFQSTVTWPITAGSTYMIDVGSSGAAPGGVGSFVITLAGVPPSGTPYCFGDGTGAACPCGNTGAPGSGCAHSAGGSGLLDATGSTSVTNDMLVLQGSGMTANSSALYFQGTTQQSVVFGDGLRCVGGSVVRLGTQVNSAGSSSYGGPAGDTPVSVRGLIPPGGGTRTYQVWYRNAATFCTSATFNLSNGLEINWTS